MPSLEQMLNEMLTSGKLPDDLKAKIQEAMRDPEQLAAVLAQLKDMGADQIGDGPPLEIEDYYREGPGKYELRWSLPPYFPSQIPFDELDRKTQFFVLFQEWSRREMEGFMALNGGDIETAEETFHECAERATQLEVNELLARSYEDLVRVAQRRGDLAAERQWLQKAKEVRGG